MTKADLYNAIPNKQGVDKVMIERAWMAYTVLIRFEAEAEIEDLYLTEESREGHPRIKSNPFWKDMAMAGTRFQSAMAELGLTPKARKMLEGKKADAGGIPTLGSRGK